MGIAAVIKRVLLIGLSVMFLGISSVAMADEELTAQGLIAEMGLKESKTPSRELPGWHKPKRILLMFADEERIQWLRQVAPDVEFLSPQNRDESLSLVPGVDAMFGFCSPELIAAGKQLSWIQTYSAGVDRCFEDSTIKERQLLVTNVQRLYGPVIAEHVMAMMLMLSRGLHLFYQKQLAGEWDRGAVPDSRMWELKGKTMLVVGLGGIGTEIARRAYALGMRVTATRNSSRSGPAFVEYVGLADELLKLTAAADVVVNAAPLTPATTGLFDAGFFQHMKPDAYFINIGRGGSVVTEDLLAALERGDLAGAGLDVTDPEPLPPGHPLWKAPNVIITPHVSGNSIHRMERIWTLVRENLRRYVNGEPMLNVVDPEKGY